MGTVDTTEVRLSYFCIGTRKLYKYCFCKQIRIYKTNCTNTAIHISIGKMLGTSKLNFENVFRLSMKKKKEKR